ncbi:RNA polymerase sigma factor [Flavimarina sp. Hel_I_48]|uniref:RNA polymerase sigma factor n=1 Tax=Flavimarina sp. Hel_I_48 TaxID=1392488 RepID=UPI0004DF73E3|nr:sigma-70 family RNA polymerase sigma factor [Flavimarina sp. Hel_I_48]
MKVIPFFSSEKLLIEKASYGNRSAQQRLFNLHAPKMLSVCRQYLPELQRAEEAMCNGFLKVFKNLKSFKHEGSFEGWVRRIMVRESISYLRSEKKLRFTEVEIDDNLQVYDPAVNDLEVEEIQRLIDSLPDGYRAVFVLYAVEGYQHNEIAEMLEITESTSKSQLYKARKKLQMLLKTLNMYQDGTHEI